MELSLNMIRDKQPCHSGWVKLLKHLKKSKADDEMFPLNVVLDSNGIEDVMWCLRCFEYKDYCLLLADIAESVLPIFENKNKKDSRPRKAIEAIRLFKDGKIDRVQLKAAADAAADAAAADAAAYAAAYAAYADAAADAADAAAYAAAYAAAAADAAAADAGAADAAAYAAAAGADAYAAADAAAAADAGARKKKWTEIETLFIKYFC